MGQREIYALLKAYPNIYFDSITIADLLNYGKTQTRNNLRKLRGLKGITFVKIEKQMTDNKHIRFLYKYTGD